tara:strand:- start:644 stop:1693 length:1050 start_codon:yes stop_codon:yes gene_type:complete
MEKPKSVDLKICFDTLYTQTPVGIIYNHQKLILSKGKTFVDLTIECINQLIEIDFFGFDASDKTQVIKVAIYYKGKKIDTTSLCTFFMENNKFVDNTVLKNYNHVFFNGRLQIQFFREWFECNLLAGSYITNKKRFLHRFILDYENHNNLRSEEDKRYDVFCIGCSFTFGAGLSVQHTWPKLLSQKLDCPVANFGVVGMSIHGCLRQALYCLENFHVKKMIVLLPTFGRIYHKFQFLGNNAYFNYTPSTVESDFKFFNREKINNKIISHGERVGKRIIKRLVEMNQNKSQIYLTSWDEDVYNAIPTGNHKLPKYPDLDIYKERASDGEHPHYKHNKFFVESIHDRIDKI